jgi:hypothetical protein
MMADLDVLPADLIRFNRSWQPGEMESLALRCNQTLHKSKKEKLAVLSEVLATLEEKPRSADAVRKWFSSRLEEVLARMNGNPPRSAYTLEILIILLEKSENDKKSP